MSTPTSPFLLPQEMIISNLKLPIRLILQLHDQTKSSALTPAPLPNYEIKPSLTTNCRFDANLIMVITLLLCALFCSLCVNSLIKYMLRCSSLITTDHYSNDYVTTFNDRVSKGINKRVLRSFSIVKYRNDEEKVGVMDTQCVICLSEYKLGDKLKMLPKCNHGFHVKCIDKWLESHSSCPTCRHSLVDTCQKIIGCRPQQSSSSSLVLGTVGVVPLAREDFARNVRG